MHVAQQNTDHTRIGRGFVKNSLEERDPSLLKLPLPLPSIPILNPLITPLVQGNNSPAPSTPAAPAPQPQPTQAPPSNGGGNGDGNGNGNGGGNSGGGGDSGNGNGSGSGNGNGSGNTGGNTGGNNGGTSGGDSGNSSDPGNTGDGNSNSGGGTTNNGSGAGNNSGTSTNSGASSPEQTGNTGTGSGSPETNNASTGNGSSNGGSNSNDGGSSDGGGGGSSGNNNPQGGPVANAGIDPSQTNGGGLKSALATGTGHGIPGASSSSGTNPDGTGIDGSGPPGSDTGNGGGSGGISTGAVAAIGVIGALIFLAILVILLRRRSIARRSERRNRWWGRGIENTNRSAYGDRNSGDATIVGSGSRSARSSFATTFDHGQTPQLTLEFDGLIPPVPPMAEIRGGSNSQLQLSPFASPQDTHVLSSSEFGHLVQVSEARYSVQSFHSNGSDPNAQYLFVPNGNGADSPEIRTPMSVRPFSPSESFAFPQPPKKQSGDWSSSLSRPQSNATLSTMRSPGVSFIGSPVPPTPALPSNPFADPSADAPSAEFSEVETIRRPFVPTLPDELAVAIADQVKVVKLFDDGWALVEKIPSEGDVSKPKPGLIPIDCLRAIGQDLPTFLNEKRVSVPYADSDSGHSGVAIVAI